MKTRRLDLTTIPVDRTTARRVLMAACPDCEPGGDINAAMAAWVAWAVEERIEREEREADPRAILVRTTEAAAVVPDDGVHLLVVPK